MNEIHAPGASDRVEPEARSPSRRDILRWGGAGFGASAAPWLAGCATGASPDDAPFLVDGHVHVTNRIYWEGIDPWVPQAQGWDFARARAAGVNCVVENIGTYGAWNYNYSPKQALRLIDTLLKFSEAHADRMAIAHDPAEARRIAASGRVAVFVGCESGFDHEGDTDVLDALYRLGLRTVQFPTQTGFNAFTDSALAQTQGGRTPTTSTASTSAVAG